MSKFFIYLEDWYEDRDCQGTYVVTVTNELRTELTIMSDRVEEWEVESNGSRKVAEYWEKYGKWVKQQ